MSTSLDEDILILENLDFDITRRWCDNTATWLMTARCCASEWKMCDEHRAKRLKELKNSERRKCNPCGYTWEPRITINYDWSKL